MRSLEYRSPRVRVEFAIDFADGTDIVRGACVDVSEKGVRATFRQPVSLGDIGPLVLHHPRCRITIPARVIYLVKDQVGFAFFGHTLRDRELLTNFMSVLGIK